MSEYLLLLRVLKNRHNTYPAPKLPEGNPDDYYIVNSAESLAAVLAEMEADPRTEAEADLDE